MKLNIYEYFGENCMTQQAGQQLYEKIYPALQTDEPVELDFTGVKRFLSVFFNFAVGQLLRDIAPSNLERLLTVRNLTSVGQQSYDRVLENATHYYALDEKEQKTIDAIVLEQVTHF